MTERQHEIHKMYVSGYVPVEVAIGILRDHGDTSVPRTDDALRQEVDRRVRQFANNWGSEPTT
ncbi:MAG: hypothetical protein ABSD03_11090 [Vulcanimicrobiaceae bacterium]|jgi:hypothetical protein